MLYRIYGYSYYTGYMDIQDIWIYMYILYFTGCMDIHIIQGIWIYILYRIYGYAYYKGYIDIHVIQDICGYTMYMLYRIYGYTGTYYTGYMYITF